MIKDLALPNCIEILENNYIGRLAYIAHQCPFVIPITYYYDGNAENYIISYSLEGHKIDAMRENSMVSIQVDLIESVDRWKSVLVLGTVVELTGIDAKNIHSQQIGGTFLISHSCLITSGLDILNEIIT